MSGIRPGLCSVTLRASTIDEVARVAHRCELRGIEWGGDVHVPPGDLAAAARARAATQAAEAVVGSYGSYLFATGVPSSSEVQEVLRTAVALGAPNVRVWAGFGVEPATDSYAEIVAGLAEFSAAAAERQITVGLEFHGGTPTATVAGTRALLDAIDAPNLFTYWQPPYWRAPTSPVADGAEVTELGPRLSHLHVYEWASPEDRRPLAEGAARWRSVLRAAGSIAGGWAGDRFAFCEFVAGDDVDALSRDAATLVRPDRRSRFVITGRAGRAGGYRAPVSGTLGILHTASVHEATFSGLVDELAPGTAMVHVVDESLLADARARDGVDDLVRTRLVGRLRELATSADVVVCTCSTISGAAEALADQVAVPVVRIDRPMAEAAVGFGRDLAVVAALASTLGPTTELLRSVASAAGVAVRLTEYPCVDAWDRFERRDQAAISPWRNASTRSPARSTRSSWLRRRWRVLRPGVGTTSRSSAVPGSRLNGPYNGLESRESFDGIERMKGSA